MILYHMCFPKNSAKAFRTPILQNADGQLLLKYEKIKIVASDKLLVPVGKFREKAKTR